jgi:mRNA-degrading endonuclease RelE of RelBE toxin-antitoxin system
MEWTVVLSGPARTSLDRIPARDQKRIVEAVLGMQQNPFHGDVRRLHGCPAFADA